MEDMGTQNMMGYNNYPMSGLLNGLLVFLVKLFVIVLIVSIIIGVILWIKNSFFSNIDVAKYINKNPYIKTVAGIVVIIVGLLLFLSVLNYFTGQSMGFSYGMGNMNGFYINGFGGSFGITGLILLLFRILTYVFIITLTISLVAYAKNLFDKNNFHVFNNDKKDTTEQNQFNVNSDSNKQDSVNENLND